MRKDLKFLAATFLTPVLLMTVLANADPRAQAKPAEAAKPSWKDKLVKGPPTAKGAIPKNIDAYTPGMMPVEPQDIPADVMAKLTAAAVAPDKIAFLKSGKARFAMSPEVMLKKLREAKSNVEVNAYVDAMMAVYQEAQFEQGRDAPTIAFDTNSPRFNDWHLRRPAGLDPKREPGPVSLSRYVRGRSGFATFAGSPVAFTPADLKAGKVDVAILGAALDMGSGWRDARHGPNAMRMAGGTGGTEVSSMIAPSEVLNIVDYGNAAIDQNSTERSVQEVRRLVREIAQTGAIPVVIGGDHSLEYPNVAAAADVYGKGNVGVIHFDSHLDTGRGRPHLLDHGQPIYRVMKEAHIRPEDYIQVGLRAHYNAEQYEWQRLIGMHYHTMAEVERRGWDAVLERVVKEATKNTKYLWISFDVDVLDPAFIPGTGTPVSGGMTMREAIPIMRRLCAEANVIGFDIVELAPQLDSTYRSAMNGNALMFSCLTGIAMRKKGLTQPNYFSPLSSEHGQDNYYGAKK